MAIFSNVLFPSQPSHFTNLLRHRAIPKSPATVFAALGGHTRSPVRCHAAATKLCGQKPIRRSANYQPPNWDYNQVPLLKNEFAGQTYIDRVRVLKEQVRMVLEEEVKPLSQLELIDNLQRLGISYHFEEEIQSILSRIYHKNSSKRMAMEKSLYPTALELRLLRQHGFQISQDIFDCFMDEQGAFKSCLCEDTKGLLYLYEASFLLTENESILEVAREFATKQLKKNLEEKRNDQELALLVQHALELPLHWRMLRLEARWFIDLYEKIPERNPILLELAKLDFNIVQATHQEDLKYALRWWKSTCFGEKLTFARDRLVENFFWTTGIIFDPDHGYCRRMLTKLTALLTTIDDVYDVYGTLDELELFTDAVERWDIKAIDQLPDYMQICYLELYNSINEMSSDAVRKQGANIIPWLSKAWADICRSYLQEARWYFTGYSPTLQEYLEIAWISISAPVILVHAYFFVSNPINNKALDCLDSYHNIIRLSAMIFRLADDLGTSSDELKRGDVPKSIQCYMNETGTSEEEARNYIRFLISETWKEFNKERVNESPFNQTFIEIAANFARMAQCMYQYGDGHGHQNCITRDYILALLIKPIHLPKT